MKAFRVLFYLTIILWLTLFASVIAAFYFSSAGLALASFVLAFFNILFWPQVLLAQDCPQCKRRFAESTPQGGVDLLATRCQHCERSIWSDL